MVDAPPRRRARAGEGRWALAIPDGLTISTVEHLPVAISRDGKLQAVSVLDEAGVTHLLLRSQDVLDPRVLPDTERAVSPFFSPDGNWLAYFRDTLLKIPIAGGPPIRLAKITGQTRGGTWSSDGYIYFPPDFATGLHRVSQEGGPVVEVTQLEASRGERTHRWPTALPDGSAVLFTCDDQGSSEYYDDARIEAVRPATGERKVLLEGASMARVAPSGHLVFARGGSLYAASVDLRSLTVSGSPVLAAQGVATDAGTGGAGYDLAGNGSAVWVPGDLDTSWSQVWVDRHGVETSIPIPRASYNEIALSPDGTRLALTGGPQGGSDLWVYRPRAEFDDASHGRTRHGASGLVAGWRAPRVRHAIAGAGIAGRPHVADRMEESRRKRGPGDAARA